jgi:hypothetical protein
VIVRVAGLNLPGHPVLAAGGALLLGALLGCSVDHGPSQETAVVFDGQSETLNGPVTCTAQPNGKLVILAVAEDQKMVRVLLRRQHQLVVEKVGVRIGSTRGYTADSGNMWATKVDDDYTINGRMPPDAGEATWHDFTIDVRCRSEATPETG